MSPAPLATLGALLPALAVFPIAGALMVFLAAHILALRKANMPESRRRIRIANGWVMLVLTPLVAGLFGYVGPDEPRAFILLSTACVALLGLMVVLAIIDASNNARLASVQRKELHREIARFQAEAAGALAEARQRREAEPHDRAGTNTPDLRLTSDPPDDHPKPEPGGPS